MGKDKEPLGFTEICYRDPEPPHLPSEPLLWQKHFHAARPGVGCVGGAWGRLGGGAFGTGKSLTLSMETMWMALRYPGILCGVLRANLNDVEETTMKVLFEHVLGVTMQEAERHPFIKYINRTKHWMRLVNGSEIYWRGTRDVGGRIAGGARSKWFGFLAFDEIVEISEESFFEWVARLRQKGYPDCWAAATNPDPNWCKKKFHYNSRERMSGVHFFQTSTRENIHLPPAYEKFLRANYPEEWVRRFLDGSWDVFEGQIFSEWDPRKHVWDFDVPEVGVWREFSVLDWGFTNPTAWYLFGLDYDDRMHVWGEHYRSGWRPAQHAEAILPAIRARNIRVNQADPSCWNKGKDGTTVASEFGQAGLHLSKADNDVKGGIMKMKQRLSEDALFVHPSCEMMIEEIPAFRWAKLSPTMADFRNKLEVPVKKDDHAVDVWRYAENYARSGGFAKFNPMTLPDLVKLDMENKMKRMQRGSGKIY